MSTSNQDDLREVNPRLSGDLAGIVCSALCLTHCLLLPVLIGAGITSLSLLADESVHLMLLAPVVIFAALSFPAAYRQHGALQPGLLAITGLFSLGAALIFHGPLEAILTATGAVLLIAAHYWNRQLLN